MIFGRALVETWSTMGDIVTMRIYYFGNLIQADDSEKMSYSELMEKIGEIEFFSSPESKTETVQQTQLQLKSPTPTKRTGMQSISEILKDIDMNLDSFRPTTVQRRSHA